jgi:hypothetical protein
MVYSNLIKKERVIYMSVDIPGKQMAATIPPFGIFIEGKYKNEGDGKGSLLAHERIHWKQYQKMGFFNFYYEYLSEYFKHSRVNNHWMEVEARILSN